MTRALIHSGNLNNDITWGGVGETAAVDGIITLKYILNWYMEQSLMYGSFVGGLCDGLSVADKQSVTGVRTSNWKPIVGLMMV